MQGHSQSMESSAVRTGKLASVSLAVVAGALIMTLAPAAAQGQEEFPGPDPEAPFTGFTRGDGTIVLEDEFVLPLPHQRRCGR